MNKSDFINDFAKEAGITKVQASICIETFISGVTKSLKSGRKVTLVGFGTFSLVKRAARKGRNPATGETIKIKAKRVAKFRPSLELNAKL